MAGFKTISEVVNAELEGRVRNYTWRKTPSQTTVANLWFDTSMSPGMPPAQYYIGNILTSTQLRQSTDGGFYHGPGVSPSEKFLRSMTVQASAGTALPMNCILCDYLMFYPFIDEGTTDPQSTINTFGGGANFTGNINTGVFSYTTTNNFPGNILTSSPVIFSSTGTLPTGIDNVTTYYLIRVSTDQFRVATSIANSLAGVYVNITDLGTGTHTIKWSLPRYTDGKGVQVMSITTNAGAGGQQFFFTYTNSEGVSGRVSQTVTQNTSTAIGTVMGSNTATINASNPFIGLQAGDSGVRSIESVTMLGLDTGLFALVLVKPLVQHCFREITVPYEKDFLIPTGDVPKIYDDAFLGFLTLPLGTLAATLLSEIGRAHV